MVGNLFEKTLERLWGGGTSVLFNSAVSCYSSLALPVGEWTKNMEHQWNDSAKGKAESSEKNLIPVPFCLP